MLSVAFSGVDAGQVRANTGLMEQILWIGLISYLVVGVGLGTLALLAMVRNAGRR